MMHLMCPDLRRIKVLIDRRGLLVDKCDVFELTDLARGQESEVIWLKRALYSLKQAGLAWWKELSNSMKDLGFAPLHSDAGIFVCREGTRLIVAVVYVDDAMFFGKNEKLVKKKEALFMAKWEC